MKKSIIAIVVFLSVGCYNLFSQGSFINIVVSLTGSVIDENTRKPIAVDIVAQDTNGKIVYRGKSNAKDNGYYFMTGLKPGMKYYLKFVGFDYFNQRFEVQIPNIDRYTEYSKDFLIKPKQKDLPIVQKVPPFELGKTKIRYGADMFLNDKVSLLKDNVRVKFKIKCYPDQDEGVAENQQLSSQRCEALKEYFVSNGIDPSRIICETVETLDPSNPPPVKKSAKGKRYIGTTYMEITDM
ncbi:MAG: hypothetical protein QG635_839 [Bacteroidota bacterium]|nr:hypothetical protein [Bacteroidota bacterium]